MTLLTADEMGRLTMAAAHQAEMWEERAESTESAAHRIRYRAASNSYKILVEKLESGWAAILTSEEAQERVNGPAPC